MDDKNIIKRIILENLVSSSRWGGKHTELRNLKKGFPSHLTSDKKGQKLIDKAIKEMVNDGLLLCKISTGEIHTSLNPRMKKEIMELIVKN